MSKNNNSIEKIFDLVKENKLIKETLMEQIFKDYEICVDAKLISKECLKCKITRKIGESVMYKIYLWDSYHTERIATVWMCNECFEEELKNNKLLEKLKNNIEVE